MFLGQNELTPFAISELPTQKVLQRKTIPDFGVSTAQKPKTGNVFDGLSNVIGQSYAIYIAEKNRSRAARGLAPVSPGQITGVSTDIKNMVIWGSLAAAGLMLMVAITRKK